MNDQNKKAGIPVTAFIGVFLLAMLVVFMGISSIKLVFNGSKDYENSQYKKVAPENRVYEYGRI